MIFGLTAREITYNNFEISLIVFMPNITTNHAITYTNPIPCEQRFLSCMADPGRGPGGRPPLFLDQNEARRAEKIFWRPPPYLRVWMTGIRHCLACTKLFAWLVCDE